MKVLFKTLLAIFALFVLSSIGGYFYFRKKFQAPANQLVVTRLPATCSFTWEADTLEHRAMPHAALLVPVRLPGCPRTCYMQFDTGAPYSVLKSNALAALRAKYPATRTALLPDGDTVHNLGFTLGQSHVLARKIKVLHYANARQVPADSTEAFVIGTLGADLMDGRVLVIDYADQRFTLGTSVPDSLARRAAFVPLEFKERRVLLNAGLQGKPQQLLFDSGSSAFALLTSQNNWQQMAQLHAVALTAGVNSWGKTMTSHTVATAASLQFSGLDVPLRTVTYIEGTGFTDQMLMRFSGMGGMLGNEPFSQQTVIFDVKGGRFGVVRP
jgi:hypothetical protein